MNKLSSTNKDFNGDNLSKYEFTISLIKECVRCDILPESFLYTIQEKIGEILKELIIKLTKGESSSITVEKAEKLIIGIWYTIDAYMNSLDNIELSIEALKNEEVSFIYKNGKEILKKDFINVKNLYEEVLQSRVLTNLDAYNDTLKGIGDFFKLYNLDYEPDECDANIDYPLAFDDWNVKGLYYMKNYLWNLYLENNICNKFENEDINLILKSYGENNDINYRDLLINIFEMSITNLVFAKLINKNSLQIKNEEFEILNEKLKNLKEGQIEITIKEIIEKIISDYNFNEFEQLYIKNYQKILIENTIRELKRNNLKNLLVITDNIKIKKDTVIVSEENVLSDKEFKNLIEEIIYSDNIYEKISIINKKIKSIKDYIDMLKSDCLFEDEYILLFMSLSKLELAILGKYVFYGEYRMDNLNILKVLSKKIETNHEWEKFYIDYLKSLSKEKLSEIEKLINEKM